MLHLYNVLIVYMMFNVICYRLLENKTSICCIFHVFIGPIKQCNQRVDVCMYVLFSSVMCAINVLYVCQLFLLQNSTVWSLATHGAGRSKINKPVLSVSTQYPGIKNTNKACLSILVTTNDLSKLSY